MAHRQYTENDKAVALAYLTANGGNEAKTARDCNVPRATLQRWIKGGGVNEATAAKASVKKGALADAFEKIAYRALGLAESAADEASFAQLMTGAGIAVDKMRLLREQTTDNTQIKIRVEYEDADTHAETA